MALGYESTMPSSSGHHFPLATQNESVRGWLRLLQNLGRAEATVEAYARGIEAFFRFCQTLDLEPERATLEHVSLYVRHMSGGASDAPKLASATVQQRLTALRQWYSHLVYQGLLQRNPVPSGSYVLSGRGSHHAGFERGLVRTQKKLPGVPSDEEWSSLVASAARLGLRDRLLFGVAYSGALRRQELVELRVDDFDFAHRTVRLRAETTKGGRERVVHYTAGTGRALWEYLHYRRTLSASPGPLPLGVPPKSRRADLEVDLERRRGTAPPGGRCERFSPHTLRHARLTHLARQGWGLHELCAYAGHADPKTTMVYVHLSGRDVAARVGVTAQRLDEAVDRALFASTSS